MAFSMSGDHGGAFADQIAADLVPALDPGSRKSSTDRQVRCRDQTFSNEGRSRSLLAVFSQCALIAPDTANRID
jgi:hypothetical protein